MRLGCRVSDLAEEVDDLLAPPDEVTGGEVGAAEHLLEPAAAGPPVHRPGDAGVRLPGQRESVRALEVLEGAPPLHHVLPRVRDAVGGQLREGIVLVAARLVHEHRDDGGELRGVEPLPRSPAEALRREQVLLGVEPPEPTAEVGDALAVLAEVPHLREDHADALEGLGHGVRPVLDLALQGRGLALELPPPRRPPGVHLPLGALVAGVLLELPAQLREALVLPLRTLRGVLLHGGLPVQGRLDPQRRREVGPLLGRLRVEAARDREPSEGSHRPVEVGDGEPTDLLVLGEHGRRRLLPLVRARRRDDQREAGAPTADADDVADLERLEGDGDGRAPVGTPPARALLLHVGDPASQGGVLAEVAVLAVHRLRVGLEGVLLLAHLAGQSDDGPVGLELREGGLEDLLGRLPADLRDEVDRHVVRRPEARAKGVGPGRGEPGHGHRVHAS